MRKTGSGGRSRARPRRRPSPSHHATREGRGRPVSLAGRVVFAACRAAGASDRSIYSAVELDGNVQHHTIY
jgi:hypothetical protein